MPGPVPLFVGLPSTDFAEDGGVRWLSQFAHLSGSSVDSAKSRAFPLGRASAFAALEAAIQFIGTGRGDAAIVGGVDTCLDARRLAHLFQDKRLLSASPDGFVPAEGAAFLLLSRSAQSEENPLCLLSGFGSAQGLTHVDPNKPHLGEELSLAIEAMRGGSFQPTEPAGVTFAGLNGESIWAKEWGVAHLRHRELFAPDSMLEHPADRLGDMGAAMGAALLVLADAALVNGHRDGPALVWCASDEGLRGCAWLQRTES